MHMSAEPSPLHDMTPGIMYSVTVTISYALCMRGLQKGFRMVYYSLQISDLRRHLAVSLYKLKATSAYL
jgi:hypothetical protein